MSPEPAFIMGMMTATLLGIMWRAFRARRAASIGAGTQSLELQELKKQTAMLAEENGTLKALAARTGDRLQVLERIATEPALRTAREIEALRQER